MSIPPPTLSHFLSFHPFPFTSLKHELANNGSGDEQVLCTTHNNGAIILKVGGEVSSRAERMNIFLPARIERPESDGHTYIHT